MHLNIFAEGLEPLDMTATDEFRSLLKSADDLGIGYDDGARYLSHNIVLRHRRFHYLEWGVRGNPPILLLHGGHQSAHSWDLVSLNLSDRYHIFALDQRGHGDSEWSRDGEYSPSAMADDAQDFIAAMGLEQPIIFGHSMGGLVSMTLLKRDPSIARAAVLVDVGPEVGGAGVGMIRDFIKTAVEFDDLEDFVSRVQSYDPFRSREHIERTVRYNMMRRADGKYVSKCDRPVGASREHSSESSPQPGRGITLEDIGSFSCPTLVVRGGQSNVLEPEAAERFANALPDGQLVTVDRCGHNVHSQNTPGFLEATTPFLAAL